MGPSALTTPLLWILLGDSLIPLFLFERKRLSRLTFPLRADLEQRREEYRERLLWTLRKGHELELQTHRRINGLQTARSGARKLAGWRAE